MAQMIIKKDDEVVMKLIHYFITDQNYSPIVLHGVDNEIWLENLTGEYKIVRIISNYIHNNEQFKFDLFKTKQIMYKIKHKTLSLKVNSLNIFLNLGDNVNIEEFNGENDIVCAKIGNIKDLKKYDFIIDNFPSITKEFNIKEKGEQLFMKLTSDINQKSAIESKKADDVFKMKFPLITYILIGLNILFYLVSSLRSGNFINMNGLVLYDMGAMSSDAIVNGEYYRLLTSVFLHGGLFHILFNMYALYIIGPQLESFLGKWRFAFVYLFSALTGNLLSMVFTTGISVGASGAIFGLLGSLLYFGYHYRIYLGTVMKSQIIPLIVLNLVLGFMLPNIDVSAHFGGLIGGLIITMALGVKYKSSKGEMINGAIMASVFVGFLLYLAFVGF
ncbi:MAG: rhomboid family intramembrane serine protease [Bacilli bacterium]